jgi:hypothetical protein
MIELKYFDITLHTLCGCKRRIAVDEDIYRSGRYEVPIHPMVTSVKQKPLTRIKVRVFRRTDVDIFTETY